MMWQRVACALSVSLENCILFVLGRLCLLVFPQSVSATEVSVLDWNEELYELSPLLENYLLAHYDTKDSL